MFTVKPVTFPFKDAVNPGNVIKSVSNDVAADIWPVVCQLLVLEFCGKNVPAARTT